MFVSPMDCKMIPTKDGMVLSLHKQSRKYFLNTTRNVSKYVRSLWKYIECQETNDVAFEEFRNMAKGTRISDWEFYFTTDPQTPIPKEILHNYTFIYSNTVNDVIGVKNSNRSIFRVEHKNTNLPVYVVDKSSATKKSVLRKAITQLKRYTASSERAQYAQFVGKQRYVFHKTLDIFECSLEQLGKHCLHDVRYEPIDVDMRQFFTLQAAVSMLNYQALSQQVVTLH